MLRKLLKNAELVTGGELRELDLLLNGDKIEALLERGSYEGEVEEFDLQGKVIIPGMIDAHVHFREPGQEYKEDFETGTRAAVAGGVTTIFDMPNNKPPIVDSKTLNMKRKLVTDKAYCNYGLFVAFNGKNLQELNGLRNIPGVKVYVANSTGDMGVGNASLPEFFENVKQRVVVHAEDAETIEKNFEKYREVIESGQAGPEIHSKVRAAEAEVKAVKFVCGLAKKYGRSLHIAHLSTAGGLEVVEKYRECGVTAEVTPHHLNFSVDDYGVLGNFLKVNPPLRSREDVFELWKGLKAGMIDIVATDHAPHTFEEKSGGDYVKVPSGVPGVETALASLLNVVNDDGLTLPEVVRMCCERPAEIYGVAGRGSLKVGNYADVVVLDMDMEKKVKNSEQYTKCGWSPFDGRVFKGWPVMTFVNGELVFLEGDFVSVPKGREVKFS